MTPQAAPGHVFVPTPRRTGPCGQISRRIPSCRTDGRVWRLHLRNGRAAGPGTPRSAPAAPAALQNSSPNQPVGQARPSRATPRSLVTKKSHGLPRRAAGWTDNQRELRPALSTRAGVTAAEPGVTHSPGGGGWGAPGGPRHHPHPRGCAQTPAPSCEASPSPSCPPPGGFSFPRPPGEAQGAAAWQSPVLQAESWMEDVLTRGLCYELLLFFAH